MPLEVIKGIPLFAGLEPRELEDFLRIFRRVSFDMGACLVRQGQPADSAFMLESGAAEVITALPGGGQAVVAALGPGRLCGVLALIDGQPHSMTALAREHATLMEIDRAAFARIYDDHTRLAARFHDAINQELLQALARTNNHLTRLISQARIRARHDAQIDVEELRRTLCTQDCRAA